MEEGTRKHKKKRRVVIWKMAKEVLNGKSEKKIAGNQ